MTAYNAVRFTTKSGREADFIAAHAGVDARFPGLRHAALVRTGDHTFCFVGEWDDLESLAAARPKMIAILDGVREMLEDLGDGLGVTDPVSGPAVVELTP